MLVEGEQGWPELCADLGAVPLDVVYKDLVDPATYPDIIRSALDHLGVDDTDATVAPRRTRRQADEINQDWVERYTADRARAIAR